MIDTALLIAGALAASQYFDADTPAETELRELADTLYRRVDWRWSQDGARTIMQGWKPECGFLHYGWEGYNEAIVLYVLALGSPTHPIDGDCYEAWTATYQWENLYGHDFLYGGPLFIHQFSHAWIDFRGIRDRFMREKDCDYFENSRRAMHVQREYALHQPARTRRLRRGLLGPERLRRAQRRNARASTASRGTCSAMPRAACRTGRTTARCRLPAVLASLPFAPALVLRAVRDDVRGAIRKCCHEHGFASGFNPDLRRRRRRAWVSRGTVRPGPGHHRDDDREPSQRGSGS